MEADAIDVGVRAEGGVMDDATIRAFIEEFANMVEFILSSE